MDIKYNRDDIDKNLSMGENALLYYDEILENNIFNRIIISTILKLHRKGYVEINNTKENELIIKIKKGEEKLRISETFIYECLKCIDTDNDSILTLNELNACENNVFAKNKKNIKELIVQESIGDELINIEKFRKKRRYFFRTLEILVIIILPILVRIMNIILIIAFSIMYELIKTEKFNNFSKNTLKKLKSKLLNYEAIKYDSKLEYKNIMMEFSICAITYCIQLYVFGKIFTNIEIIFFIETAIMMAIAIAEYIKFSKVDVYTDKAIQNRQKLKGLEKYLKDYSLIENRKAIEIYLWEDYLTYSVILGINNSITDEIKLNIDENS